PLSRHATQLPRDVTWYCAPLGAMQRIKLRRAGFTIQAANNAVAAGIAAVKARIASGRLYVKEHACPRLVAEASLYRYGDDPAERMAELPADGDSQALSALRYLVTGLDDRAPVPRHSKPAGPQRAKHPWLSIFNEALWTRIWPLE